MIDLFESAPTFDDPLGVLRACHRRIERALTALRRIAAREAEGALDASTLEALRQVLHYFGTGVPRHAADEEEALFPSLRMALTGHPLERVAMLEELEQDHARAEAAHQELDALGRVLLQAGRFEAPEQRHRFSRVVATLKQLYEEHIRREDDEVLPLAAQVLAAPELERVGCDMAARRGIDWKQQRHLAARLAGRSWSLSMSGGE